MLIFQFLNPGKCCFSILQSSGGVTAINSSCVTKAAKEPFPLIKHWIPLYCPCFGVGGEEKRQRGGNPLLRCGWLSQGRNSEGWTDRQTDRRDPDCLSPARKRQHRASGSSVSQRVPLQLWGFLYLSPLQPHSRAAAEGIPALTDCWNPAELNFWSLPGQLSLQSCWNTQLKRCVSSLPISFGDLALPPQKKPQKVTGSFLIFFFSPIPSNDPTPKCYFPLMDCVLKECQNAETLSLKCLGQKRQGEGKIRKDETLFSL